MPHRVNCATTVAEWVWCPNADISTPAALAWIREAQPDLEYFVRQRPQDRYCADDAGNASPQRGRETCSHRDNSPDVAKELQQRALELFLKLAQDHPNNPLYAEHIGWSGRNLGEIARRSDRLDEAAKHYQSAAEAFGGLAANPRIPQRDGWYQNWQADSLMLLAQALAAGGHPAEAEQAARSSVEVCEMLTKAYPANSQYRQRMLSALNLLSDRLEANGRADDSNAVRRRSISLSEELLVDRPKEMQGRQQLAWALTEAAEKSYETPELRENLLRRALILHTELASELAGEPLHFEQIGHLQRHLSWIERGKGQLEESRRGLEQAVGVFAKLAADRIPQRDGFYRGFQADTLKQLASVLTMRGHTQEAVAAARRSVEIYAGLVKEYPHNIEYSRSMGWAVHALAERLVAAGQPEEGVQACRQQVTLCEKLQQDFPQNDFKAALGTAYLALASTLVANGQADEANQAWDKSVEIGHADAGPLNNFAWNLVAASDVKPTVAALAVQAALEATKLAPQGANNWNTLGVAQYRAGKWEDAIAVAHQSRRHRLAEATCVRRHKQTARLRRLLPGDGPLATGPQRRGPHVVRPVGRVDGEEPAEERRARFASAPKPNSYWASRSPAPRRRMLHQNPAGAKN